MLIPIPRSVGQLTGWKAIVACVVIVGIIAFFGWSSFQPHTIDSGTWELNPGRFHAATFQYTESGKLQAEFESVGSGGAYTVMLVSDGDREKLSTVQAGDVQPMQQSQGSGKLRIAVSFLNAGKYAIVAMPAGKENVTVKYNITGSR